MLTNTDTSLGGETASPPSVATGRIAVQRKVTLDSRTIHALLFITLLGTASDVHSPC